MERLSEFALKGRVGALCLGLAQDHVRGLLGDPEQTSAKRPTIWRYGQLEIVFDGKGEVSFIAVQVWQTDSHLPPRLGVRADISSEATIADVLIVLSERGAVAETIPALTYGDQVGFRVPQSGVHVFFVDGRLHSLQKADDSA